jgi:outer membrane protein assembly factor BamA
MKLQRLLFLFVMLLSVCALAQQYPIAELRATGSKRFAEADILRASGLEKGKREVPLAQVKDAASKLLGFGTFTEVSYKHTAIAGGMKVEFAVKDTEEFVPADFDNIVWLPLPELSAELHKRVPLFSGELPTSTSGNLADEVAAALQGLLNERGVKTTISFVMASKRDAAMTSYVFTADEAEVKMGSLTVTGASAAFTPKLSAAIKDILGTHYQRSTLEAFIKHNLRSIYEHAGHLRAEFGQPQVAIATQKDNETIVAITLPVQEGRAYTFAGVQWSGNTMIGPNDLTAYIHQRVGQPVDGVQLAFDMMRVRMEYAQRGYMHMLLDFKPTYDETAGTVRYDAAITENELFNMGKLEIAGLAASSEERVRQRWRMREGDPYDAGYVKQFFAEQFRLPRDVIYVLEQSEGEAKNSIDLTLIFCKDGTKCLASAPNQLYIPDTEPRRRR